MNLMMRVTGFTRGAKRARHFMSSAFPPVILYLSIVKAIDTTAGVMKGSKGRSGCSDKEWLVIGGTRQSNFKNVLRKLAELKFIRKISETFWE